MSTTTPGAAAATTDGPSGPRAGFWRRVGAAILDSIVVGIGQTVIMIAIGGAAGILVATVLAYAYFVVLEGGATGQTLGKRALSIRVIDFNTGGPLGYPRALLRNVAEILSAVVVLLGYLWMIWDREKQTWHDKLASSVVVPVSAYPVGPGSATGA